MKKQTIVNRKTGYYWVKNRTGVWMIAKWWNNLQFWDTMTTIENDTRPPFPVEVDEKRLVHEQAPMNHTVKRTRKIQKTDNNTVKRRRLR